MSSARSSCELMGRRNGVSGPRRSPAADTNRHYLIDAFRSPAPAIRRRPATAALLSLVAALAACVPGDDPADSAGGRWAEAGRTDRAASTEGATVATGDATSEKLGTISLPNSGAPEAQDAFIRGVLLLHSFEYEDARSSFQEARAVDPDFALAYWGEAQTYNHPLWSQQDREAALETLATLAPTPQARQAAAPTRREKMYLAAVDALYGEGDKRARDEAHMEAMGRLHEAFPEDREAAAFYALSILGSVPARDFRTYMRAAAVAEEVFAENPDHPGAAHYLIHSYDDPIHAPLGLRAARRYSDIAPAAAHAQHMVSHIYTALGHWDEVVEANTIAVEVSEDRLRRLGRSLAGRNKHALLWLEYALLQQGRFDEAREALATMEADAREQPYGSQLWHYAAMRAAYAVADPTAEDLPPEIDLGETSLTAVAMDALATGLHGAARGDIAGVRAAHRRIVEAVESTRLASADEGRNAYDGATSEDDRLVAEIAARELEAILLFRSGETERALELMSAAAADEESRPLEYGPPSVVKPTRELLGEMLLVTGHPDEAIGHFEKALERNTSRVQSLAGLARASEAVGRDADAAAIRAEIGEFWRGEGQAPGVSGYPWLETAR